MPTPLVYEGLLYVLGNNGVFDAYDLKTGDEVYRQRLTDVGNGFSASPVAADGKIYLSNEDGDIVVVSAGREFKQIATNPMGELVMATPALSEGVMYVRTARSLFAIGQRRRASSGLRAALWSGVVLLMLVGLAAYGRGPFTSRTRSRESSSPGEDLFPSHVQVHSGSRCEDARDDRVRRSVRPPSPRSQAPRARRGRRSCFSRRCQFVGAAYVAVSFGLHRWTGRAFAGDRMSHRSSAGCTSAS